MLDIEVSLGDELPDGSVVIQLDFKDAKTMKQFAALGFRYAIEMALKEAEAEETYTNALLDAKQYTTKSSGNVFADFGLSNPDKLKKKAAKKLSNRPTSKVRKNTSTRKKRKNGRS